MNKIRKGDEVIVLTGRDKGKRGTVSLRKDDSYLVIDGINLVKKHVKPNPMKGLTAASLKRPCQSISPTWPSSMPLPARLIA
jgi:large subunit ribosomal protein L24